MKRNLYKAILVVACIAVLTLGVCGTVAFISPEKDAINIVTMGNIKIKAVSEAVNSQGQPEEFNGDVVFVPSKQVPWKVSVENTGDNTAFVKIRLNKQMKLAGEGEPDVGLIGFDINNKDWTYKDGFYFYNKPLEPKQKTEPIFTKVSLDASAGNMYQGSTANITADVVAVQTANNATDPLSAAGWPEV